VHAHLNGDTDAFNNLVKLALLADGDGVLAGIAVERVGGDGTDTLRRLEYRMVDLQSLFRRALTLGPADLELGCDFFGPSLKTGIDGLDVDGG
jgi:hypothetical protein